MARAKYGLAMNKYKTASTVSNGTSTLKSAAKGSSNKRKAEGTPRGKPKAKRQAKGLSVVEVLENDDDAEETEKKVKVEPKEEATSHDESDTEPPAKEETAEEA